MKTMTVTVHYAVAEELSWYRSSVPPGGPELAGPGRAAVRKRAVGREDALVRRWCGGRGTAHRGSVPTLPTSYISLPAAGSRPSQQARHNLSFLSRTCNLTDFLPHV